MPYQKLNKPRPCPLDLTHKPGARRSEWYVRADGEVGDKFCADCSRAKSRAKRERAKKWTPEKQAAHANVIAQKAERARKRREAGNA